MKIGFIRYPQYLYNKGVVIRGGSEIANQYIIDYFKSNDIEVVEFEPKNAQRIDLVKIQALGTPLMFQDLLNRMEEINSCDLIFTTNWFGSIFPEINKPIITVFHHDAQLVLRFSDLSAVDNKSLFNKWLKRLQKFSIGLRNKQTLHDQIISIGEQYLADKSVRNIVVSDFLKENLIKDYNLDKEKIRVVFNSFPLDWLSETVKKDYHIEKLKVVCLTRLPIDEAGVIVKGVDRFFEILATEKNTDKILIASTKPGVYANFIKTYLDKVTYIENASRKEVKKLLKGAQISIHTSRCESFGLSVVESMLMGNIPIMYSTGVVDEFIENGVNGFIVKNHQEVLKTIKLLNKDRKMLERISLNARKSVLEKMAPNVIGQQYLEIVKEVL